MSFMQFELLATDGQARRGRLTFPRGTVETPVFMPVGTYGTVKGMLPRDIKDIGAQIILGNTFHLWLRPGTEVIRQHGDLHNFMQWQGPILTDSGGFQVFSLGAMRKIKEEGVYFSSPVDGRKVFMGPEESMQVQRELGSDVVMIFDECTPYPADYDVAERSMELSLRWAKRSKIAHGDNPSALFGIVQGGMHEALRQRSLEGLCEIGFDGLLMSDDVSMKALSGDFSSRTRAILAAGCDVVLHCNGVMDEMREVAEATDVLSGKAQERAGRALSGLETVDDSIEADIRNEFASLMEAVA